MGCSKIGGYMHMLHAVRREIHFAKCVCRSSSGVRTSRTEYATRRAAYLTSGGLRSSSEYARAHAMHDAHRHSTDSLIFAQNRIFLFQKLIKRFFQLLLKCLIA